MVCICTWHGHGRDRRLLAIQAYRAVLHHLVCPGPPGGKAGPPVQKSILGRVKIRFEEYCFFFCTWSGHVYFSRWKVIFYAQILCFADQVPKYLIIGGRGRTYNSAQFIPNVEPAWFPCFNTTGHYAMAFTAFIV